MSDSKFIPQKVSCIVPAYNEALRIANVLNVLIGHELIDEVIVINDASTDNTEEVLNSFPAIISISNEKNMGKTYSLRVGMEKAKNNLVILIDSDLLGLTKENLTNLIAPVTSNQADISISIRGNSLPIYKLLGLDFVSGERVFNKNIIEQPSQLNTLPGFGFEVFLNSIILQKKLRIAVIPWPNVQSPRKSTKFSYWEGQKRDFKMILEIISIIKITGVIKQFYFMLKQKVKLVYPH